VPTPLHRLRSRLTKQRLPNAFSCSTRLLLLDQGVSRSVEWFDALSTGPPVIHAFLASVA
jgi:hypothetical protein